MTTIFSRLRVLKRNAFGLILFGTLAYLVLLFSVTAPAAVLRFFGRAEAEGTLPPLSGALIRFLLLPPLFAGGTAFCVSAVETGKGSLPRLLSGFGEEKGDYPALLLSSLPVFFLGFVFTASSRLLFTLAGRYTGRTAGILFALALLGSVFTFFLFAEGIAWRIGAETRRTYLLTACRSALLLTLAAVTWRYPLLFIPVISLFPLSLAEIRQTALSRVEIQIEGVDS